MDTTKAPPDRLLTLPEVCDYLGISAPTLYGMRHQGRGPVGYRVGRQLRFRRSEVDAWLQDHRDDDQPRQPIGA